MAGESTADGLIGEWLSLDELLAIEFFKPSRRTFKVKLNATMEPVGDTGEPRVKAAVRREFSTGDVICRAGEYGSSAFLIIEGQARASVPGSGRPATIRGRASRGWARMQSLFRNRYGGTIGPDAPTMAQMGESSVFGTLAPVRPPMERILKPGDFFGIDTCINFYPREATVIADGGCVVIEFLRCVLDAVRDAGASAGIVNEAYRRDAIHNQLALTPLFADFSSEQLHQIQQNADLLTPDSEALSGSVIYEEGDEAEALYVVRSGTVKLSRKRGGGEFVFAYLGKGAVFGLERVVPSRRPAHLEIRCSSHADLVAPREIRDVLRVGRHPTCEIHLPSKDRTVGRLHCVLEERDDEVFLIDKDSANFTLLNGERIREAILSHGDRIKIVAYEFEVLRPSTDETAIGQTPLRLATATALDNFELIRIDGRSLRRVAGQSPAIYEKLYELSRAVDTAPFPEMVPDPAVIPEIIDLNLFNSQNVLLIDLERCTRCDECVRACADAHGGVTRFQRDGPRFGKYQVTIACRSCTDPKCMIGCPVGSIRRERSLEIRIEDWCVGCQVCANQCPFGNINMLELEPSPGATPPLRATVCDLCAGYDEPNCVYACPHDAAIRVNPASFVSSGDCR